MSTTTTNEQPGQDPHGVSRRGFLAGMPVAVGGAAVALSAQAAPAARAEDGRGPTPQSTESEQLASQTIPFDGKNQAGIAEPEQAYMNLLGLNIKPGRGLKDMTFLMRSWTADMRRLTQGKNPLGSLEKELSTSPANLTVTCGYGPGFFSAIGAERAKPSWLKPLPAYKTDKLEEQWGQTDLALQVCCDDPVTLAFAVRHLLRSSIDYVEVAWVQQGFMNADGTLAEGATPRNLFGQKDGTVNPRSSEELNDHVWITEGPEWQKNGTCMIARRIFMNLDTWELLDRTSREVVIGRDLENGAPLSGGEEFDDIDPKKADRTGLPIIDPMSHAARAKAPKDKPEQVIKRRPYQYSLPPDPKVVAAMTRPDDEAAIISNVGLVFICFQKDPLKQFDPIQKRLAEGDRLNQWITHIGSAVYFVPPGVSKDGTEGDKYWGASLLESLQH
ncbi:Dyp-type peroxidase [Corynebacterium uropygiale]|uniref:Dyp-type peroxidase n=1 Tax=Corynebacterium uropygiale TaxID=1775911 RepID=A0A9X1TZ45_9CORY|nr:Dyp-type peroxidase [Corynebacterium uropygiale]MCF4006516.1 Dyp-type peroxidase [Corynebacterium uropygiale]